jgi:TRAP-type C4-dicarboxylate transport system permease small subunit
MKLLQTVLRGLAAINDVLLSVGRVVGVFAISIMVIVILIQVYCRYILGSALPWPDEAARFCMLWMTGLMAPTALRNGGFVAIDTIDVLLPNLVSRLLQIVLLLVSLTVLIIAVQIGYKEVTGLGGRFATASLYVPQSLVSGSLTIDQWYRVPRSWMMTSLLVGIAMLILVNIELILGRVVHLFDPPEETDPADVIVTQGAESRGAE